mmetsp:Transcript_36678/g.57264  ORF Transcript_36678/g.57264 Transcript_36678/m.57264 type:complete len:203 (+) Transcript_36678:281-889(+)
MARPETASDLAESPSVRMSVHSSPRPVPAKFASSSFGTPDSLPSFRPEVFFSCWLCLNLVQLRTASTSAERSSCFRKASGRVHCEPKAFGRVVRVSLVWESNAGFSMRQLMYTLRWQVIRWGLISVPEFLRVSMGFSRFATWSAMYFTCWPPLMVQMPFTNEICCCCPSLMPTPTSHLSLTLAYAMGVSKPSYSCRYSSNPA